METWSKGMSGRVCCILSQEWGKVLPEFVVCSCSEKRHVCAYEVVYVRSVPRHPNGTEQCGDSNRGHFCVFLPWNFVSCFCSRACNVKHSSSLSLFVPEPQGTTNLQLSAVGGSSSRVSFALFAVYNLRCVRREILETFSMARNANVNANATFRASPPVTSWISLAGEIALRFNVEIRKIAFLCYVARIQE